MKRCVVLHQALPDAIPIDDQDVPDTIAAVVGCLHQLGWQAEALPIGLDLAAARRALTATPVDLVFNLVDTLGGCTALSVAAPALLDGLGLRFTGADYAALTLTADKRSVRRTLRAAGVTVPEEPRLNALVIVKHATEHASFGLDAGSVRTWPTEVPRGWFAEAYVEGREFNVALLDGDVLAVAEAVYCDWPADIPRIYVHAAKWDPAHPLYDRALRSYNVSEELAREAARIARRCWRVLGLGGYARIDMRVDDRGVIHVIDVNCNPCLAPEAGYAAAVEHAGLSYETLVARIVAAALRPRAAFDWRMRHALRDTDDIAGLCRATGFFTPAEIALAAELAADRVAHGDASCYRFLLAEDGDGLAGYACYAPTQGTHDAWDLYWIVVHPRVQGGGLGRRLVAEVVSEMMDQGGGRLYAETAGKPLYAPTRGFYAAAGFARVAVIPDFYAPGDDKQIWAKTLDGLAGPAGARTLRVSDG